MSVGQQLSPDAKYQLALKMPIERLMAIIRGQPAQIDPATALAALKMYNQTKVAAQGQQAQQQLQQPNVANQEMQASGLTQIPANNMNGIATAAQGGIVGYADGGEVQHFQVGGVAAGPGVSFSQAFPGATAAALPYAARLAAFAGPAAIAGGVAGAAGYGLGRGVMNLTGGDQAMTDLIARITGLSAKEAEMLDPQQKEEIVKQAAAAPAARNAAAAPAAPAAAAPASGVQMLPTGPTPPAQGLTMGDEKQTPEGLAALREGPVGSALAPAEGVTALRPSFTDAANKTNAANPFSTQLTKALTELTSSPEEKDKQKGDRLGVMALQAAQALLKPGTTSAGARSDVFGKIAELTQQYNKEDKEDKRALIGAKISVLGTQATLAQGDTKNAIDMFNHGETLTMEYAKVESEKAYRQAMLALEGSKLSQHAKDVKAKQASDDVLHSAMARYYDAQGPMAAAHGRYWDAAARAVGNKGTMTQAQTAALRVKAAAQIDKDLTAPGAIYKIKQQNPALKDLSNLQIRDALIDEEIKKYMPGAQTAATAPRNPDYSDTLPSGATVLPYPG